MLGGCGALRRCIEERQPLRLLPACARMPMSFSALHCARTLQAQVMLGGCGALRRCIEELDTSMAELGDVTEEMVDDPPPVPVAMEAAPALGTVHPPVLEAVQLSSVKAAAAACLAGLDFVSLTLTEGKKHEVRLLLRAVGFSTLRLVRVSHGLISDPFLLSQPGTWRNIRADELVKLRVYGAIDTTESISASTDLPS